MELEPGLYDSSPPFDVDFTFEIPDEGWESAHIHGEFFDVMRFDGPDPRTPTRWVAWGRPETIYGDRDAAAADLTPREAVELISRRNGIEAGPVTPFTFAGLEGVQLDLHAGFPNTRIFGGEAGDFGLQASHDARLGIVSLEGSGLLLVLCLAAPDELDAACTEVQPILDSVEL